MNIARALGVKAVIFHTNHIPNFRLDSYRKNCLDFAHAFLSHTSLEEWGTSLKPYVTHLHLNDNNKDMNDDLAASVRYLEQEHLYPFS